MASSLVRSSSERAVRVQALAGDIMLCSWARHFTLTVPLFTQMCTGELNPGDNPVMDEHLIQKVSRNTPSRFMLQELPISAGLTGHLACIT